MKTNKTQNISYIGPFLSMVFLFLIVGFLTTANTQFQGPLQEAFLSNAGHYQNTLATLITFSWFLAYPIAGIIGAKWVDRKGYKVTLLRGVVVMVVGLLLFFLSSWFTVKYPGSVFNFGEIVIPVGFIIFLLGSFVLGSSATILQVVINPYLTACDVKGTQAVQRLAIGGTANSIGTTAAPYFVTGIVFGGVAMQDVQVSQIMTPFLCLAAVMLIVFVLLKILPLPDIQESRNASGEKLERSIWSFRHLTLGVIAIFFYVGCEVCIGANINMYAIENGLASPALLATIYWGGMLVGRSVGSTLSRISPRVQLCVNTLAASTLLVLAVLFDSPWLLAFTGLFHSTMWGAIFTLATNSLGKYTSIATGVFMTGVVGGAILPIIQGGLADMAGSWRFTWLFVLIGEAIMLLYALIGSKVKSSDKQ